MDKLTEKYMGDHIQRLIDEFKFTNRNGKERECPCYKTKTPCHDTEDLNCFLCYCPWYATEKDGGECKIDNPLKKGRFIPYSSSPTGEIWDCTNCDYPNQEEVVRKFLWKFFKGEVANEKV